MKKTTVSEVMTQKVVVANEDTPFKQLARLMTDNGVRGLPVLDEDGRLVGVVSEEDLLAAADGGHSHLEWLTDGRRAEVDGELCAGDVMTRDTVTIAPEEPVDLAARVMLRNGVTRLPVVDAHGRVVGIVTRTDLLRPFLRDDDAIRQEILHDLLLDTMWIDPSSIEIEVEQGVVTLRGMIETRSTKDVLVKLVRTIRGVIGVIDHLTFNADDRPTDGRLGDPVGFGYGRGDLSGGGAR